MNIKYWRVALVCDRMVGRAKWHWGKLSRTVRPASDLSEWEKLHADLGKDLRAIVKSAKEAVADHRACTHTGAGCSYRDVKSQLTYLETDVQEAREKADKAQMVSSEEAEDRYEKVKP